ncbi:uncharacterized protein LOC135702048 [Ochlerotatus camptorhynchus]|uniref:uncharacterized protein LOC135702048 n=1 Tax=Ochlerotatus camptorhynchus TaxID=644619 RepID=UPI0031D31E0A
MSTVTVDLLQEVRHLRFALPGAVERDLRNAWHAYRVSDITRQLASEAGRELYAEAIAFDSCDGANSFFPKSLAELVVDQIAKSFESGSVPQGLSCEQKRDFGYLLDVELPILNLLHVDNDTFWRRVVKAKTKSMVEFLKCDRDSDTNWKNMGVALKVAEVIEQEQPEYWFVGSLEEILIKSQPFVRNLVISQLKPLKKVVPVEGYQGYKVVNPTPDLCHHGSLVVLKHLQNLTSLSLIFGLGGIIKGYEPRFFQFSLNDMENLTTALSELQFLEHFKLSRSRMEPDKLKALLGQLSEMKIKSLELSYCYLGEDVGFLLGKYISKCPETLERIDLSGNFLDGQQIENFGYGINVYQGVLKQLDLSHNPIGETGVLTLGGAIVNTEQVRELNLTGCDIGEQGAFWVAKLLAIHKPLRILHMNCTPLGRAGGKKLIEALKENWFVVEVNCKFCNLKPSHERRIQRILRRNKQFLHSRKNSSDSSTSSDLKPSPNGKSTPQ